MQNAELIEAVEEPSSGVVDRDPGNSAASEMERDEVGAEPGQRAGVEVVEESVEVENDTTNAQAVEGPNLEREKSDAFNSLCRMTSSIKSHYAKRM